MKYFSLIWVIVSSFLIFSCSDDNSSMVESEDVNFSKSYIAFDENIEEQSLIIDVNEETNYSWKISKLRNRNWLSISSDTGRGTKTITLKVDRSKMDFGINYDTLEIRFSKLSKVENLQGLKDSIKRIPISAVKVAYYADIIKLYLGNEIQLSASYLDSTYCLLGSFRAENDNISINTALATFYSNNSAFSDAGSSIIFKAKNGIPALVNIDLQRFSFSFTGSNSQTNNGYYYMPQAGTYPEAKSSFDDSTYHVFYVSGISGGYSSAFTDSIMSVSEPVWSNQQILVNSYSTLNVNWDYTYQAKDYVFAVIVSASDTTKRVMTSVPVEDQTGTLNFDSQKLSIIKQAGSSAYLYLIRYRIKIDNTKKRIFICQAQKRYNINIQ